MKHPDLLTPLAADIAECIRDNLERGLPGGGWENGIGLIIDNFAGGGGASTGIEAALGRAIDVAINHDAEAIAMHRANHPATHHYCQSVWKADPQQVVDDLGGGPVGLAWFSPDCKHFSKAKGGKPVEKNIRDLAWVVVEWAQRVQPRVIMLENVEEFITWRPLGPDGRPVDPDAEPPSTLNLDIGGLEQARIAKAKKRNAKAPGSEFLRWTAGLRAAGYKVQWKELKACDYGAPTSRKRLFIIARCDGQPIVWPEPTHGKPDSADVLAGRRLPWRTAAEIIDWSIPCPSIFERKKELKDATKRRIAHGIMRYVVNSAKPFIVPLTHHGPADRSYGLSDPIVTVTGAHRGELAMVAPVFARTAHGEQDSKGKKRGRGHHGPGESFPTVLASQDSALITATMVGCGGRRGQSGPVDVEGPYPTTTSKADACLVAVTLDRQFGRSFGADAESPLPTITAGGSGKTALLSATLIQAGYGERKGQAPRVLDLAMPLGTIVAGGIKHSIVTALLVPGPSGIVTGNPHLKQQFRRRVHLSSGPLVPHVMTMRNADSPSIAADPPARTVTAQGHKQYLVGAFLHKYRPNNPGASLDVPAPTVTANSFIVRPGGAPPLAVVCAHMEQANTGVIGHSMEEPVSTIIQKGCTQRYVATSLIKLRHEARNAQGLDEPLHTITAGGMHFAEVAAFLIKYYGNEDGGHGMDAPIGTVTTKERFGLVTVMIDGEEYVIADIGMRMLTPRELARAQGFPDSYVLDPIVNGKPLTKTAQIRMIGNSVCPPLSEALVRANVADAEPAVEAVAA